MQYASSSMAQLCQKPVRLWMCITSNVASKRIAESADFKHLWSSPTLNTNNSAMAEKIRHPSKFVQFDWQLVVKGKWWSSTCIIHYIETTKIEWLDEDFVDVAGPQDPPSPVVMGGTPVLPISDRLSVWKDDWTETPWLMNDVELFNGLLTETDCSVDWQWVSVERKLKSYMYRLPLSCLLVSNLLVRLRFIIGCHEVKFVLSSIHIFQDFNIIVET